jgi:hypothetical protein
MSISRPALLVLIGAALLGATVLAVTGARNAADDSSSPATQARNTQQGTGGLDASQAFAAAFSGSGALDSGKIDARVSFSQAGGQSRRLGLSVQGAFQGRGKTETPLFDVRVKVNGAGQNASAGAVSVGDRAFLTQGGTAYRVPPALWKQLQDARGQIASFAGKGTAAPTPGLLGVNPATWLTNVKDEGDAQVDGVTTKHVSASIDAAKLVRDIAPLARQGGANVNLPDGFDQQVTKIVKQADVDIFVGQEDRILRRLKVALNLDLSAVAGSQAGRARVGLDLKLTDVNKPQDITAPKKVSAGAPAGGGAIASGVLGVGVLAVDPSPGLAAARKAGFRIGDVTSPAPITNNPRKVAKAVRKHQKVVIFFRNPRGLDDQATTEAVRALRARTNAKVFIDDIRSVDRFGTIVQDVGVDQAPSIVILDRRGRAHLTEGYVDVAVLAQEVADVR